MKPASTPSTQCALMTNRRFIYDTFQKVLEKSAKLNSENAHQQKIYSAGRNIFVRFIGITGPA